MNAKSMRLLIRTLKGRSFKTVAAAGPDAIVWHLAGSVPSRGFSLRRLPATTPEHLSHTFEVQKGAVAGRALVLHDVARSTAQIVRIGSTTRDSMGYPVPLDLGVKGYRRLFRGMKSAVGAPQGTKVRFFRVLNPFNRNSQRYITREGSSVRLR